MKLVPVHDIVLTVTSIHALDEPLLKISYVS
jgi:hypothetical protein